MTTNKREINQREQIAYMLSFLAILIHRAGGTVVIDNLSEFQGSVVEANMELDLEHDRVTLRTDIKPLQPSRLH